MSASEFSVSGIDGLGFCFEKEAVDRSDMFGMSTLKSMTLIRLKKLCLVEDLGAEIVVGYVVVRKEEKSR